MSLQKSFSTAHSVHSIKRVRIGRDTRRHSTEVTHAKSYLVFYGSETEVSAMFTLGPLFLVYQTDPRVGPGRST